MMRWQLRLKSRKNEKLYLLTKTASEIPIQIYDWKQYKEVYLNSKIICFGS